MDRAYGTSGDGCLVYPGLKSGVTKQNEPTALKLIVKTLPQREKRRSLDTFCNNACLPKRRRRQGFQSVALKTITNHREP